MTTIVRAVSTGRDGQVATIRGTGRLSGQVLTTAASTSDVAWTVTRWQVLKFAIADATNVTPTQAAHAAAVLMCVWANESGWGANEWNYNGCGMHCGSGDAECTEWPRDEADPRLAAYRDLAAAMRAFWRVVSEVRATPEELAALYRGELVGLAGLYRRGVFGLTGSEGRTREEEASALFRGVRNRLTAGGVPAGDIPPYAPMPAGAIGAASATGGGGSSGGGATGGGSSSGARRGGGMGAVLGLALVAALVMGGSKRKR